MTRCILTTCFVTAVLLFLSYQFVSGISAASTGYNAKEYGVFGGIERIQEHEPDDSGKMILIRSYTEIHWGGALKDVLLCGIIGVFVAGVVGMMCGENE